jgi:hypothetical protein
VLCVTSFGGCLPRGVGSSRSNGDGGSVAYL